MIYNENFKQYELTVSIKKGVTRNALLYLPQNVTLGAGIKHPLLIVHPGSGEVSIANNNAGILNLVKNGIPRMIKEGWKPAAKNPNTGIETQFIVLSIQQNSTGYIIPPDQIRYAVENCEEIKGMYDYVFMTGLSLGGCATAAFMSELGKEHIEWLTAVIPMSAKSMRGLAYSAELLKEVKIPVWQFCGKRDTVAFRSFFDFCENYVSDIESTLYDGGHDGWINQYKNARSKDGYNPLEWCLSKIPIESVIVDLKELEGLTVLSAREELDYLHFKMSNGYEYILNENHLTNEFVIEKIKSNA